MPRNGAYFSLAAYPFVSLWNALYFVLVTLLWSNLFGIKQRTRSLARKPRSSFMASRTPSKPFKNQNSLDETDDGLPEEILNLRTHHKQAYGYITKALEIDEEEGGLVSKKRAVDFYKKGISELEIGLQISCDEKGEEWHKARRLQDKMKSTLTNTRERLDELVALLLSASSINQEEADRLVEEVTAEVKSEESTKSSNKAFTTKSTTATKRASNAKDSTSKPISNAKFNGRTVTVTVPKKTTTSSRPTVPGRSPVTGRKYPSVTKPPGRPGASADAENAKNKQASEHRKKISHLKNVDSKLANHILDEIIESGVPVHFDDIGRLHIIIMATVQRHEVLALRCPYSNLLTLSCLSNFKVPSMMCVLWSGVVLSTVYTAVYILLLPLYMYVGEGEKLVRALFAVARELQPSIIFIDEVDSLLCERKEGEQEHSRRMKTEFLVSFDGVIADPNERILVMGATNRPQELDDAALRRFVKRVYVPLPDKETRKVLLSKLLVKHHNPLSSAEMETLSRQTEGYSGSDLTALARDAALGPIRDLRPDQIQSVDASKVRNIQYNDFRNSLKVVRPSLSPHSLKFFEEWNSLYGSSA
ncbi:unnamed protein product [Porites evermanni]|uniref:MIT domain-containing protein n=1 Tax=Porites evermanni TaxID=104178 RepID=A0ABN8RKP8_9CNID|nr:unnamed protein product [Porites evermanni]